MFIKLCRTKFLKAAAFASGLPVARPVVTASHNNADLYGRFKKRK